MSIVLPTLAMTFTAFCIYLTVRIVNRRERWAKWTQAGLLITGVGFWLFVLVTAPWLYVGHASW